MKVAVLGSGGREHAIAWRLLRDKSVGGVYVIPGNSGMSLDRNISCLEWSGEFEELAEIIEHHCIDFVIVGPETLLEKGITDYLDEIGVVCLGPSKYASKFESSKSFSKLFMEEFKIPTAKSVTVTNYKDGLSSIEKWSGEHPPVVKASGLAAGKGVFVASTLNEAKEALYNIMKNDEFPVSDTEVLLEERLIGKEVSSFALFDGVNYKVLGHSSDYKRLHDNDLGPNTGGMGTICNDLWPSEKLSEEIERLVFKRFRDGLAARGIQFRGILFAGLMVTEDGDVNVIEFNVRFGDPEAQSLLPCIEGDLCNNLFLAAKGNVASAENIQVKGACVHVVLTTQGYPFLDKEEPLYGQVIPRVSLIGEKHIFYAGVSVRGSDLINSGGRVLGISARSSSLPAARKTAYEVIPLLSFNGAKWRTDVGR